MLTILAGGHLSEQAAEIAVPPGRERPAFMLPSRPVRTGSQGSC